MKITDARFIKSALKLTDCPKDNRPEIAFAGRSNVGKSTLLNALMNRNGLAKTSKTPGKTQTLNYFLVNDKFYLVDLPGYGYAKAPKALQATWGKAITTYLEEREPLRITIQLLDARREPGERDHELLDLLDAARRPVLLVATKMDKLKRAERSNVLPRMRGALGLDDDVLIIPFSSVTGEGRQEVLRVIADVL